MEMVSLIRINVRFQTKKNHKNRVLIITILLKRVKKKKKRNQHLNREIEVNGENFQFERSQIERKAPKHGPDFGLDPDYGPDGKIIRDPKTGKPQAKQTKKITKNLQITFQNLSKIQNLKKLNLNIVKDGRMSKMQLVS